MKRFVPISLAVLLLALVSAAIVWQQYQRFLQTPLDIQGAGMVLEVESGANLGSVLTRLELRGVTRMSWQWRLLSRLQPHIIKAGEYELLPGLRPLQLMVLFASGKVVTYRFTIVEGWSVNQLLTALAESPVLKHTLEMATDLEGQPGLPVSNPEGWFLPETYAFVRGDSDVQILKRAFSDMQVALSNAWRGRDTGLPYESQDELLIMASIVEKETSLATERADIAGVFVRRLLKRWRLETDPTVIYGMGQAYKGDIRRRDLKTDTPYNTYTRHGLPPTPIALPGLASIQAAAHPANGDAMFFVANGKGGHTFSSTLEAHNKAVKELVKRTRSNPADSGTRQ